MKKFRKGRDIFKLECDLGRILAVIAYCNGKEFVVRYFKSIRLFDRDRCMKGKDTEYENLHV